MRRLIAVLMILLLVGGCGKVELNEQAIVRMVGIDRGPDGTVIVSARIVVPKQVRLSSSGSGASQKVATVFSSTGKNFADAVANLQMRVPRRLDWTHTGALVLGEAYARQGIRPTLDYLARHTQANLDLLIVTTKGKAESILRREPTIEINTTEIIERLTKLQSMPKVTLKSFLWALEEEGESAITTSFLPDPQGGLLFDGSALYRKDRLARWLSPDQTRVILWFRAQLKEEVITVPVGGARVTLQIRGDRAIRARMQGGRPALHVQLTAVAGLMEAEGRSGVESVQGQAQIEAAAAKYLTERTERVIHLLKQQGTDALRVAHYVERVDPRGWAKRAADWPKQFAEIPIHVEAQVSLKRTGRMLRQPGRPHMPEGAGK